MNKDFSIIAYRGIEVLVYQPWWSTGLLHGMTTQSLPCTRQTITSAAKVLCNAMQVTHLALPSQCHGNDVYDLRDDGQCQRSFDLHGDLLCRKTADCLIAPREQTTVGCSLAYGIMTADCVPIIARGADGWALIHAGWRGLASGVISNGMSRLSCPTEAVVFAAAGSERYEVDKHVINAIGASSSYKPSPGKSDAYLLDTAATAINQLRGLHPDIKLTSAEICTIHDSRFHSFRRGGEQAGRGITFIIPPQAHSL